MKKSTKHKKILLVVCLIMMIGLFKNQPVLAAESIPSHDCNRYTETFSYPSSGITIVGADRICRKQEQGYSIIKCKVCGSLKRVDNLSKILSHSIREYWLGCDGIQLKFEDRCEYCGYVKQVKYLRCTGIHPWSLVPINK